MELPEHVFFDPLKNLKIMIGRYTNSLLTLACDGSILFRERQGCAFQSIILKTS